MSWFLRGTPLPGSPGTRVPEEDERHLFRKAAVVYFVGVYVAGWFSWLREAMTNQKVWE